MFYNVKYIDKCWRVYNKNWWYIMKINISARIWNFKKITICGAILGNSSIRVLNWNEAKDWNEEALWPCGVFFLKTLTTEILTRSNLDMVPKVLFLELYLFFFFSVNNSLKKKGPSPKILQNTRPTAQIPQPAKP